MLKTLSSTGAISMILDAFFTGLTYDISATPTPLAFTAEMFAGT
jgi:hypothetical protein